MTGVIYDVINARLLIGGQEWLVSDVVVETSLASTPNYVDINKMIPAPSATLPDDVSNLIGQRFELYLNNELVSNRDASSEEETLLFRGNLANISATGVKTYEGIAYDPSQQGFASTEGDSSAGGGGQQPSSDGDGDGGSSGSSDKLSGTLSDAGTGKTPSNEEIIFVPKNESGERSEAKDIIRTTTNEDGVYKVNIDSGKYTVQTTSDNFSYSRNITVGDGEDADVSKTGTLDVSANKPVPVESLKSGSELHQQIDVTTLDSSNTGDVEGKGFTVNIGSAKQLIEEATEKLGLNPELVDIQLTEGGVERGSGDDKVTGAFDRTITFHKEKVRLGTVFQQVAERTDSTFWFDRKGIFHFGVPDSTKHELTLITKTSDGLTTPPYQSVRVIGSSISSQEGWSGVHLRDEERDKLVEEWVSVKGDKGSFNVVPLSETERDSLPEPVFTYKNAEVSTQEQAATTAKKIAKDLAKQQAKGKITVVGFPEINILDAVVMPQAEKPNGVNYNPRQPMGGNAYSVYKVIHKINGSNGFKTEIHTAGLVGAPKIALEEDEKDEEGEEDTGNEETDSPDADERVRGGEARPVDEEERASWFID